MAGPTPGEDAAGGLPRAPIQAFTEPLVRFLHVEAAGGVVLLGAAVLALVLANCGSAQAWLGFWKTPLALEVGTLSLRHSLQHWINDGLMPVFFFVIGLEVKRELVLGELRDPRRAVLPLAAALGGMLVPAGIYLALEHGQPGSRGWGIPMATDIAFVVGCLALLGSRVPRSLRVLLLSLAIVDDIGAILVIAFGYTDAIAWGWLGFGALALACVVLASRLGVRSLGVYGALGVGAWLGVHESGIHATIAGVVLGLLTPAHAHVPRSGLGFVQKRLAMLLSGEGLAAASDAARVLRELEFAARESVAPLERLEARLHPWTSFVVLPLFALANAGVPIAAEGISDPIGLAVMAGLVIGKPLGLLVFSALAVAFGLARIPEDLGWGALCGAGLLAGIGFTMALFIAGLALEPPLLDTAKLGVLVGSLLSGAAGMLLLRVLLPAARR